MSANSRARRFAAAVDAEAEARGIAGRVREVHEAIKRTEFARALNEAIAELAGSEHEPADLERVREIVHGVLVGMGASPRDVLITLFWSPDEGSLRVTVRGMTPAARAECEAAVRAREAWKHAEQRRAA